MKHTELKNVFDTLEKAFTELSIDYYLIGALARQIWYERAQMKFRTTRDVDYAILVGSHQEYETVKQYLIKNENYLPIRENAFVLISPDGFQVDLLPFGEIESQGSVKIEGIGMTTIQISGMKEVYENGTEIVNLETGNTFKAATLIGIVLLKLVAYDDRPERRQKDATDIGNIFVNFFDMHQDLIYANHLDMFDEQERTLENISAIVLGREIKKIISSNANLIDRLNRILNDHINSGEKSIFTQLIIKEIGKEIDLIIEYLRDILWGFENPSKPVD
ncbi:Predicted nucleotidyltransferase [Dyadobacter koreensis]|uniref:Predicted nucleotidyltransferase n=1 Tax=Dyadobacter koreensis TaxID=408657 RepID=A0A1H6ZIH0_9BACT|nr:hypothetical protein [Dyadobacter koreensis]SEJ48635.1 Predicted nucleotidyltransferase [Dyadobacter koreensis]